MHHHRVEQQQQQQQTTLLPLCRRRRLLRPRRELNSNSNNTNNRSERVNEPTSGTRGVNSAYTNDAAVFVYSLRLYEEARKVEKTVCVTRE